MDSGVWDRHSVVMEKTSEKRKERLSAKYHSDSENCGTSLKQWGEKEVKSSMSYTDVSEDSAYISSNRISSTCFRTSPARSFTDSGREYSVDFHPSETSCDEELLDSEEMDNGPCAIRLIVGEEFKLLDEYLTQGNKDFQHIDLADEEIEKEYLTPEKISTPKVLSIKDQHLYFQRNYTFFKEHLEPSIKLMDEIISSECRDKSFPERIREAPTRQRKADILIKYAARYLDKDSFESLLERTEHGHLIQKLKTGSTQEACLPAASEFENMIRLLYSKQFKELLVDEIEPRLIIDRLVEHEVLRFDDHEDVLVTDYRPTRVESLMKYINRNSARNCIYFFKVLKESYPHLIHQFDSCDIVAGCESTSNFDIMTMTGGWRLPQSFSVDESAELKFNVRLSPSSPDVEMRVVDESETNMDVEYNMKLLDLQLESMKLGSIVIVHKQLTAHAIQKIQEACSTGEIKRYIKSLFTAKDVKQLRRDGVKFLAFKITAEKSQQVQQKLFKTVKITQDAICRNDSNLDSVIPGVHGSFTDTTWMVTCRELQENASFLLDELEPKEYVNAFDSILSQDVQSRLIADFDRRERAKLFLEEMVKKGQPAVDIFTCELDRLGRHHIVNILRGTDSSGINANRTGYQIRTSIVKNYSVFLAELEPKIIGTFFVERRLLDNALYEKICQIPFRRNRVVTFLKWLLNEERPDAYFAFQKAMRMFYSETFVKLLEITEPLTAISSPAADKTNDVARTHVLLYLARFKITFSNDTSDECGMVVWPLNMSENETDLQDIVCKYQETKESLISVDTDLKSNFSFEEQTESVVARGSESSRCGSSMSSGSIKPTDMHILLDSTHYIPFNRIARMLNVAEWLLNLDTANMPTTCEDHQFIISSSTSASRQRQAEIMRATYDDATAHETNQASSETCMPSDLNMTEEDKKLVTNDFLPNRDGEPKLLNAKTLRSIQKINISSEEKVAKWLLGQSKKSSTADCFSIPEKPSISYIDPDKQLLMESPSAESVKKQDLLTIGTSAICECHSKIVSDQYSGFSKSRMDASVVLLPPDKSNSNTDDEVSKPDLGYTSNSDPLDIDQMTTSSFTSSGRGTRSLKTRECSSHLSECECISNFSLFDTKSQRNFIKPPIMMSMKSLTVKKLKRKLVSRDARYHFGCCLCQSWNSCVEVHMNKCNVVVTSDSRDAASHYVCCYCPRFS